MGIVRENGKLGERLKVLLELLAVLLLAVAPTLPAYANAIEHDPRLYEQIRRHEGMSPTVYRLLGACMIGIGHKVSCTSRMCVNEKQARTILRKDVARIAEELDTALPWWRKLSLPRQAVILNMAFTMGTNGLLGFDRALTHIKEHRFTRASRAILASLWARQTGGRARELAEQMRTGRWG